MSPDLTRVCVVGGNAVSAFLSWRLQATNSCDVTLVWKSGFDSVSQYGISFKSTSFGNERFKPRHVVRTPEEAEGRNKGPYDYVLLCVKALPDVYDLASIVESVVTPHHTCIIVNTTNTLGIEAHLEARFPSNAILSLVSGAEITQLGASEFEQKGSTDIWIGPANKQPAISTITQSDLAEAIATLLSHVQVNCHISTNIRQQQYERMIGPIAFHPLSVIFDTPSHTLLIEKIGVRIMIQEIMDELLSIATAQDCKFGSDFKEKTIKDLTRPTSFNSVMFQDYLAKRPMEVETYLGSPIKLAQSAGVRVPRIETVYAILHNMNIVNQQRKDHPLLTPNMNSSNTRLSVAPPTPRLMNGGPVNGSNSGHVHGHGTGPSGRGRGRALSGNGSIPPVIRRGPATNGTNNGYAKSVTGPNGHQLPRNFSRRGSLEGNDLEEFSHLVMYDDIPESGENGCSAEMSQLALREREIALRQRELVIREQELRLKTAMNGGKTTRRGPKTPSVRNIGLDDDDEDDYFDPADGPPLPLIDPDNFDMMSVTSRRNRKATPNQREIRKNPEICDVLPTVRRSNGFGLRHGFSRNRSSARINVPLPGNLHVNLMDDQLLGYSSNRYGNVDRAQMGLDSRSNSLTATRLDELQGNGSTPWSGQSSQQRKANSPGNNHGPVSGRVVSRKPSPPNGNLTAPNSAKPSPTSATRLFLPQNTTGHVKPATPLYREEQNLSANALALAKGPINFQSLTSSASARSTDSANIDSEPSTNSSEISLRHRSPIGVK